MCLPGDNASCGDDDSGHYRTLEAKHDRDMKKLIVHLLEIRIRLKGAILMFVSDHIIIHFVYIYYSIRR